MLKHNAVDIDNKDTEPEVSRQVSTEVVTLPVCNDEYMDMDSTEPKVRKQHSATHVKLTPVTNERKSHSLLKKAKDLSSSAKLGRSRRELVLAALNKIEPEGCNEGMVETVVCVFLPVQESQRNTSESYSETPCPPNSAATALDDDVIGASLHGSSNNEWTHEESRVPRSPRLWEAAIGRGRDFVQRAERALVGTTSVWQVGELAIL